MRSEALPHITIPLSRRAPWDTPRSLVSLRTEVANIIAKYNRTLTAYQINTGNEHSLAHAFYARHPPTHGRTERRDSGVDPLTPYGQPFPSLWSGSINVGTPSDSFTVDFDTGSSDLFLPGPDCDSCQGHNIYQPSVSQTSVDLNKTFTLAYGDGSKVSGEQYIDTVVIAGLTVDQQPLGVANQYSESLQASNFQADGILGMAFPSLAEIGSSPVFQTLMSQKQVSEPLFAFRLAAEGEGFSALYLGSGDFQGEFTYTTVTEAAYWQVTLESIEVNGKDAVENIPAIIDTGTTLILGDGMNVLAFYEHIPGAFEIPDGSGFWSIPCRPPTVSLKFGGQAFPILPQALVIPAYSVGEPAFCVGAVVADSGIIVSDSDAPSFWVVGDAFLRGVFAVFDAGNQRVGFAALSDAS
ncbi:hypothetical protein NM688_g2811 [Phlebia brevispora]|uniref:Uncharacterized protein n=1 Tax=Phlebia brevispora TaxID=194682 RepID=A0ACC1T7R9_9APHY|nr:hypothetical protein NM688_g2811 [Phlebia brevispora]